MRRSRLSHKSKQEQTASPLRKQLHETKVIGFMNSKLQNPPPSPQPPKWQNRRPSTIAELAKLALDSPSDASQSVGQVVSMAHAHHEAAVSHINAGNLETGFVELIKAAIIVTERVPAHPDYQTALSPAIRGILATVSFLPHVLFVCCLNCLLYSAAKRSWLG
jgi:hypothetical protein